MTAPRFLFICFFCLLLPLSVFASETARNHALQPMDEAALDDVTGSAGVAIMLSDIRVYNEQGKIGIVDTTGDPDNYIEFQGIRSLNWINTERFIEVWVAQNAHGVGMVAVEALDWYQDMFVDVDAVEFMGEDLGSLHFELQHGLRAGDNAYERAEYAFYVAPYGAVLLSMDPLLDPMVPGAHTQPAIAFQFETKTQFYDLLWDYNPDDGDEQFRLGYFQVAGAFDPYDPNTDSALYENWNPQGRLKVGNITAADINEINPASFRMAIDSSGAEDRAFVRLNLPMEGSMRMESVQMTTDGGPADLGPVLIDGMTVHHLQVDIRTHDAPWDP